MTGKGDNTGLGSGFVLRAEPRVIIFLGAPGSGKGTQSAWLASHLGISSLSTGDMLRAETKRNTPAGRKLRKVMASGALVEDSLVCAAVQSRLQRDLRDRSVILDGFPRTRTQAEYLDRILSDLNLPGPTVLHLEVAREKLLPRMTARRHCVQCGAIYNLITRPSARGKRCENDGSILVHREDDSEATIRRRFTEFDLTCAPLLEHYSEGNYYQIDGDRDPDAVSADLLDILGQGEARAAA